MTRALNQSSTQPVIFTLAPCGMVVKAGQVTVVVVMEVTFLIWLTPVPVPPKPAEGSISITASETTTVAGEIESTVVVEPEAATVAMTLDFRRSLFVTESLIQTYGDWPNSWRYRERKVCVRAYCFSYC